MRLQIISDTHFDFHEDLGNQFIMKYLRPESVDVLIIAGDLGGIKTIPNALALLSSKYRRAQILYVLGNHECYGSSINNTANAIKTIVKDHKNVTFLYNSSTVIYGIMFIGSTLWFKKFDEYLLHKNLLSDFSMINGFIPDVFNENERALDFLKWHVNENAIVITHHVPSWKSISERYLNNPISKYFVCNLETMIMKRQPKLWVHGHTHDSSNYLIGKTHIVCNPLGYVGQSINQEFIANMMIDV